MTGVTLLGSTGSVGRQTLEVIDLHRDRFQVVALTAWGGHMDLLQGQVNRFRPLLVVVGDPSKAKKISPLPGTQLLTGIEGIVEAATHPRAKVVVAAMVGVSGLRAVYEALKGGKRVALANKETLVVGGQLIMPLVKENPGGLMPVDSEHSALFQCLMGHRKEDVKHLWLTASGGPFLDLSSEELTGVTPEMALAHPVWNMGPKITVDSATLMNKGLEVIEAYWLFSMDPSRIKVLIHPQGIIHSLVEFKDGALLAQMGPPDMRVPIAYALGFPERLKSGVKPLDLTRCPFLTFQEPDSKRFPLLDLAYEALRMGGTAPAALNAANEVAVGAFLQRKIPFLQIVHVVKGVLRGWQSESADSLEGVLKAHKKAQILAQELAEKPHLFP